MSGNTRFSRSVSLVSLVVCLFVCAQAALAAPEVEIQIGQAAGLPGDRSFRLDIYLRNYVDSIAGFELWFVMDRPRIAGFEMKLDTVGTLISNWDYLDIRSVLDGTLDAKITGMCDAIYPFTKRGFAPQNGRVPLVHLLVSIPDQPDPYADTVFIHSVPDLEHFGLATPDGRAVGVSTCIAYDTTYLICTQWRQPDSFCTHWEQVFEPPYDTFVLTPVEVPCLDTVNALHLVDGFVRVGDSLCGDIDGSLDGLVTMDDLTRLIDYLFISLQPVRWSVLANVDGSPDGLITMSDLTRMIDHLFITLAPMVCPRQ